MTPKVPILLLKTRSSPNDSYDDFFNAKNYIPSFIPVLEHRFNKTNLSQVRNLFVSGAFTPNSNANTTENTNEDTQRYGGMIFTSQRAVEGFANMIEQDGLPLDPKSTSSLILYTVGPATARSLTTLRDAHLPGATIYGADAGTGENLAHMILEHYNTIYTSSSSTSISKPALLFLVGEQRRDIIPKTLMSDTLPLQERITVEEIVVYETGEMDSFEKDFQESVQKYENEGQEEIWVVVFSPSGCEAMLRVLGLGPFASDKGDGNERKIFVATIGPTTLDYLRNKFAFEADVCAEKPSPDGIVEGIQSFMAK
ncbi:Tetrapyrrole biosynthesis uroporphyrinogen III synthase [Penicillium herquei]|nr:Tetrapyrrole biosynthesis uroporphyrinogen III synthase [Penicillium herquei]